MRLKTKQACYKCPTPTEGLPVCSSRVDLLVFWVIISSDVFWFGHFCTRVSSIKKTCINLSTVPHCLNWYVLRSKTSKLTISSQIFERSCPEKVTTECNSFLQNLFLKHGTDMTYLKHIWVAGNQNYCMLKYAAYLSYTIIHKYPATQICFKCA